MIHKKRGPFARFPFKAIGTWWRGARFPNVTERARSITNTHIYMSIQPAHRPSCRPPYFPFGAPFVMDLLTFLRILEKNYFTFSWRRKSFKAKKTVEIGSAARNTPSIHYVRGLFWPTPVTLPSHLRLRRIEFRADRISSRSKWTTKLMLLFSLN